MARREMKLVDVERFLRERYGSVADVRLVEGGAWSIAFEFTVREQALVIRFGQHIEDYEKDRMAGARTRPLLPYRFERPSFRFAGTLHRQ